MNHLLCILIFQLLFIGSLLVVNPLLVLKHAGPQYPIWLSKPQTKVPCHNRDPEALPYSKSKSLIVSRITPLPNSDVPIWMNLVQVERKTIQSSCGKKLIAFSNQIVKVRYCNFSISKSESLVPLTCREKRRKEGWLLWTTEHQDPALL